MNKKLYITLIILIFIIAIAIRIINYPNAIDDINCDEAMTVINAQAIAENGTDIYGTSYPVYFESWLYGGQSAFATYVIALFIKLFGFSTAIVRLPILIFSILGLVFILLLIKKIFNNKLLNLIILILLAINPWHILQSQWTLDCNFFPHILVIAIYCLLVGIEEKNKVMLYISMLFFAITLYTYGVALYLVPLILLIIAIYLLVKRKIAIKELFLCVLIFLIIGTPIILMAIVNLFDLQDIHIGKLTIQNFQYVTRNNDMLIFSDNKLETLYNNIIALGDVLSYQSDGQIWNSFPKYGTIYLISLPIIIFGIMSMLIGYIKNTITEENMTGLIILIVWTLISFACGILINGININRINVMWYILIIWNAIGIYQAIKLIKYKAIPIILFAVLYLFNFIGLMNYYKIGTTEIANSYTWSMGLVDAVEYVENIKKIDKVVLSYNVCNTDKKDVFIRYATKRNQKEKNIDKKEFLKYYLPVTRGKMNYTTDNKEYKIENIDENTIFTESIYVLEKSEYLKIQNKLEKYDIEEFNKYIIITKNGMK